MSRRPAAVASLALVAAAAIGAGLWLAFRSGPGEPSRSTYLAEVSAACRVFARPLSRIGAPSEVTAYGDVLAAVGMVVPLLRKQEAGMQAVDPPASLQPGLDRLFALDRRSVAALEATRAAARRRDAGGVVKGLGRFSQLSGRVHSLAAALGIRCTAGRDARA